MSWITRQDLIEEYGEGDFPQDVDNQPNFIRVDNAIIDARYFIEGYLKKAGISFPLSDEIIAKTRKCSLVVTRYYYSFNTFLMSDELEREYNTMRTFLIDVANGKIILEDSNPDGSGGQKGSLRTISIDIDMM